MPDIEQLKNVWRQKMGRYSKMLKAEPGSPVTKNMLRSLHKLEEQIYALEGDGKSTICLTCSTELTIPGGYGGTDLCGPCCTGESETLEERGETW